MKLSQLSDAEIQTRLAGPGLAITTGRFTTRMKSNIPHLCRDVKTLYGHAQIPDSRLQDFSIELSTGTGIRQFVGKQVNFAFHGQKPFAPLPESQATPLLEWGMNWCVSSHYHESLLIHAAVVEKNGRALVLPGQPGAGKSTLCSGLVYLGGYRLLSDEMTMLDVHSGDVLPNPRPISLKNKAINIISGLVPHINRTPTVKDTVKGAVSLFEAPEESTANAGTRAQPGLVIFPKFDPATNGVELTEMDKGHAFIELGNQSFNFPVLGTLGFNAISKYLASAGCYSMRYNGDLKTAIALIDELF